AYSRCLGSCRTRSLTSVSVRSTPAPPCLLSRSDEPATSLHPLISWPRTSPTCHERERVRPLPRRAGTAAQRDDRPGDRAAREGEAARAGEGVDPRGARDRLLPARPVEGGRDRKSTRLNSSHRTISYAVFCLKKK